MKTSIDLPDDLYRQVKSKSALEGRAVREVATALFKAWVDGKAPVIEGVASPAPDSSLAPNAGQIWLARWRELATSVTQSVDGAEGLVNQLYRDRR